jgi:hypothetical protein
MTQDISEPGTLFEFNGVLHETIGHSMSGDKVVWIQPVRERDYDKCECGRPLPSQQHGHVLYSPNLQEGIGTIFAPKPNKPIKQGEK